MRRQRVGDQRAWLVFANAARENSVTIFEQVPQSLIPEYVSTLRAHKMSSHSVDPCRACTIYIIDTWPGRQFVVCHCPCMQREIIH